MVYANGGEFMSDLWTTTAIGFLVGVLGTGLGGAFGFFIKNPSRRFLSGIIGLSGGIMLSTVAFELIPEALDISGVVNASIGVGLGAILSAILDNILETSTKLKLSAKQGYLKTGILLGLSIAMHNFPEGLAIGSGFMAESSLGISLAIVIALHNVPEGIAMVVPMKIGGYGALKAFMLTLLVGAPMGLGAYFGVLIGELAYSFIGICLAFAGGTMLYITIGELVPKGKELDSGWISTMCAVIGFILGIIISKRV